MTQYVVTLVSDAGAVIQYKVTASSPYDAKLLAELHNRGWIAVECHITYSRYTN